jgi:hypothetical protein
MRTVSLLLSAAAVAGLIYNGMGELLSRRALAAARRENEASKARQAALRDEAFSLGTMAADELERGRQIARFTGPHRPRLDSGPRPPARDAPNESIIAWLSSETAQLQALAGALPPGEVSPDSRRAAQRWERLRLEHDIHRALNLELPENADTNPTERQLRRTGDSS